MAIIEVDNVTKRFRAARGVRALLGRGGLPDLVRGKRPDEVTALEGITFNVEAGESVGIIGANGSGKSTLLKIIAGVTTPTEGSVRVHGRVASLLELGAGFHPLLSGRENVYLNAGIHGVRHAQVDAIFDRIVEFSGIGKFIDFPVATYSSGMYVRLGFAVAAHTNPDIFLIDEVLAVGDEEFQRKCRLKIGELMESGKTILFVSHDLSIVNVLCRRAVLLRQGNMIARDSASKAIDYYLRQIGAPKGVHTLRSGDTEAMISNGRISLFHKQEELTTPQGFRSQIFRLNGWRSSLDAEWTIHEATDTRCVARGYDEKLGLTIVWELRLEGNTLVWTGHHELERPLDAEVVETTMFFPVDYNRWVYDDESGKFQDISVDDVAWAEMTISKPLGAIAGILAPDESPRVPVLITMDGHPPHTHGLWANTEYLSKSRVFRIAEHMAHGEEIPAGTRPSWTIRFDLDAGREEILRRMEAQAVRHIVAAGPLTARVNRGQLQLSYNGRALTAAMHAYESLLIDHLWNDSRFLRWDHMERVGDELRVSGASRRFPFRLHWSIKPAQDGVLLWTSDLEALEEVTVDEYQTSLMLSEDYTAWATSAEQGTFPTIGLDSGDWVHLNQDYSARGFARATGTGLPTITLQDDDAANTSRMTVLNSEFRQAARVLQALRVAEHGAIRFAPGMHRLFTGRITAAES